MVDVAHRFLGQNADRLAADAQNLPFADLLDADALRRDLAIGGLVLGQREQGRVLVGHVFCLSVGARRVLGSPAPIEKGDFGNGGTD